MRPSGRIDRRLLAGDAVEVAPLLLGALLTHESPHGDVTVRLTEVEAYRGGGQDPGSHAHRGETRRNARMFGEPGHLYAYFTYGMHTCANVVCSPVGAASGVLLRAGEVVAGLELARSRRRSSRIDRDLARGPARLTVALGIDLTENGADLFAPPFRLEGPAETPAVSTGPRVGVSGPGGGLAFPWRFWSTGDPTVSVYRRHPASAP